MKSILFILAFGIASLFTGSDDQPDICGEWISESENGKGIVEIFKGPDGKYYGKLLRVLDETQQAALNHVLKEKEKTELMVLSAFEYAGNNQWKKGFLFSPERRRSFDGKLHLNNKKELLVTGYKGFYSKTFTWLRKGE